MMKRVHLPSLRSLFPRRRSRGAMGAVHAARGALKGSERRVIVIHPPGGMFSEAVFVLNDDYYSTPGISREALLRQARAAAEEYTRTALPETPNGARIIARTVIFSVLAAALVAVMYLTGVI